MEITIKRSRYGSRHSIMQGNTKIGEVWKIRGSPGFGLSLKGVYWSRGEPNRRGGATATGVKRLKDSPALAEKILERLDGGD